MGLFLLVSKCHLCIHINRESMPLHQSMELVSVKYEYEYTAKDGRQVSIKPNERYILVSKTNEHWWHVRKDQHTRPFYVPAQYMEVHSASGGDHPGPNTLNSAGCLTVSKPADTTGVKLRKGATESHLSSQDASRETYRFSTFGFCDSVPDVKPDAQTNATVAHTQNNLKTHNLAPPKAKGPELFAKPYPVPKVIKEEQQPKSSLQDDTAEQTSVHDEDMDFPLPPPPMYDTTPELIITEFDTFPEPPPLVASADMPPTERQSFDQTAEKTSTHAPPTERVQDESLRSAVYVNVAQLRKSISESPPSAPSSYSPSCLDPEGWEVHVDQESGQEYYYHPATGRTTWDSPFVDPPTDTEALPPEEPYSPSPPQSPTLSLSTASPPAWTSDWEQLVDETSGRPYFYNPMSGETSWELPEQPQSPYPPLTEPMSVHRFHEDEPPPLPEEDYPSDDYPAADPPEGYEDIPALGPPPTLPKEYALSHVTRPIIPRANLDRSTPTGWNLTVEHDGTWVFTSENSPDQWIKSLDDQGQTYYYLRDGSKSLWNLPEAPLAHGHTRVENGVETDGISVFKNWRHTMGGPVQFISAQDEGRFAPTHRRNMSDHSSSDSSSTANSPETQQNVQNLEKAGILNKTKVSENGRKVRKNWAQTWTVLHGGVLTFHKDPKSASGASNKTNHIVPEVAVDLRGATIGWATKDKSSKKNVLELKGKNGVEFLLQYDTESIINDWHKVLVDTIRQLEYQEHHSEEEDGDLYEKIPNIDEKAGSGIDKRKSRPSVTSTTGPSTASETDQKKVRTKLMKFLMKRPTLQTVKEKGYIRENVFGCDLAALCALEKTTVPSFVQKCIHAVEKRGLDIDGLYRVSGNLAVIQKLRFKADHDELDLEDGQWEDVHVITGALKLFFRELPEPLFPYSHFNKFISAIRIPDNHTKRKQMYDLITSLPDPNHDTMQLLFGHLHRVIECGQDNRMTVQNVAIVFGPTLLRPEMESGNIAMYMVFQNQIVEFILNEYNYLFQ